MDTKHTHGPECGCAPPGGFTNEHIGNIIVDEPKAEPKKLTARQIAKKRRRLHESLHDSRTGKPRSIYPRDKAVVPVRLWAIDEANDPAVNITIADARKAHTQLRNRRRNARPK